MDIKSISLSGSLSDEAAKDILSSQLSQLSRDFPEPLRELMADWIGELVHQLWDHTADIPKADIRLKSLSLMLAKKVDKARAIIKILQKHGQEENLEFLIDLLSTL